MPNPFKKPIHEVAESDLLSLVGAVREDKTVDFKTNTYTNTREWCQDASSFANTVGGCILIGVSERQGVASSVPGITINVDQEILRLEGALQTGLDPRIPGVQMQPVQLTNGNHVIAVDIPKSWQRPHMVTVQGSSKFFARNSAGKYQLDVRDLRHEFLGAQIVSQETRNFSADRLVAIGAGETPINIGNTAKLVIHVLPISSFSGDPPFIELPNRNDPRLRPLVSGGYNFGVNFDGLFTYSVSGAPTQGSYVLAFRNGVIEACDGYMFASHYGKPPVVYPNTVEKVLVERIPDYLGVATERLQYPAVVTVGILGALGTAVRETGAVIDRDPLVFPTVLVERNDQSIATILRPVFDSLANMAGLNCSPNYDSAGEWHSPY